MAAYFLVAAVTAMLTYSWLWARLGRRDTALAVRRLAVHPRERDDRVTRHPRLIEAAGEVRGRLTARLLETIKLKEAASQLLEQAALKWGPAGLLQRSLALFLAGFTTVTLATGNTLPLFALGAAAAAGIMPLVYARRMAGKRLHAFEEQFPDCLEFISR